MLTVTGSVTHAHKVCCGVTQRDSANGRPNPSQLASELHISADEDLVVVSRTGIRFRDLHRLTRPEALG